MMREITIWILDQACRMQQSLARQGMTDLRVAVNLTAREFEWSGLPDELEKVILATTIPSSQLELEITEGVLMRDTDRTNRILAAIRNRGIRLVLDDFGTGYASLAYLHRFPVHALKIDRSFVNGIGEHEQSETIVRAIVGLSHRLGLETVAEGIERVDQFEFLRAQGCDYGQGFGLARPQPDWSPASLDSLISGLERIPVLRP
jgi:EAL domain-containing protein (putative c-di-GMP-specific phosphodiesterase class I)